MKNRIGKRVFRLVENQFGGFSPDKSTLYTIVKEYCPEDDFHMHYVLRDDNGNELDIVEYECVVAPNFATPLLSCLTTYLQENGICGEVSGSDFALIRVLIVWGDWKHDHLWCKDLMGYIGYKEIGNEVTEEDGSDCYSAVHYFREV